MASVTQVDCHHEEKVLETLASIKVQVFSALQQLQEARESAADSVNKAVTMNVLSENNGASTLQSSNDKNPACDSPLSRDEVKAQREAKKAAKAARKSKSGTTDSPVPGVPKPKPPQGGDGTLKSKPVADAAPPKSKESKPASPVTPKSKPPASQAVTPKSKPIPESSKNTSQKKLDETNVVSEDSPKTSSNGSPEAPAPDSPESTESSVDASSPPNLPNLVLKDVDPRFKELGLMFLTKNIRGSNQRTLALLNTVKRFVKDYRTPEGKGFKQDISAKLQSCLEELRHYRPFAVGMTSAVDGLNGAIRGLEEGLNDDEYRETLEIWCDTFIEEKVEKAMEAIAQKGCEKIDDGDTILVFSLTDVIFHLFKLAGEQGKKFKLLLAITNSDTYIRDYKELKKSMGAEVFKKNVSVSIVNISCIMSFISSVNKVFLGGHALFTTGGVMAHAGSSTIALCASIYNIPTLFFCETYKFCDKSPTDAFYYDVFSENNFCFSSDVHDSGKTHPRSCDNNLENGVTDNSTIRYDVTPVNLVTCVITDIDMLPSSSVPVVLRVQEDRRPLTKCL